MSRNKIDSQLQKVIEFAQVMMNYDSEDAMNHAKHVRQYTELLCREYNDRNPMYAISELDLTYIYVGASLHDIGQISVPDAVRAKSELNADELEAFKLHSIKGAQIVDNMADICKMDEKRQIIHNIVYYHHERYDGYGYPSGLKGDNIPLEAQIVSIAEVYDALVASNYSKQYSHEEAMEMICSGKCGAFNPKLIECLKGLDDELEVISTSGSDERRELITEAYTWDRKNYWTAKRLLDIVCSLGAITVFSPIMLAAAIAIKIDDPKGGIFFKQTRLGRHKQPFKMYKFRTMVSNADELKKQMMAQNEKDGPVFKIKNDPRVTRVGRFLRKSGIDEIPQFFNVLKGDMSIVGPRPPLPEEVAQYSKYHEMRLSVTPGITCIWQIQKNRDDIGFERWVDMDVSYIGTRSIAQDIRIMLGTAQTMLFARGH